MPAKSLLEPEAWGSLKIANIRGVKDEKLAIEWGVSEESIRKRRERDPVWKAAVATNREHRNGETAKKKIVTQRHADKINLTIQENLKEIGEKNALLVAQKVAPLIKRGLWNIGPPDTWGDLSTANKMVENATGRNKENAVTVNLASFWSGEKPGAVLDVES